MRWFDEVSRESLLRFDDRELDTQDLSGGFQEAELRERGNAVVKADLLQDFAVLDLENGCTSKVHFAARRGWQRSDEEIPECRPGMGTAPFPLPDDIVAFSKQKGCPPEIEIRERLPKIRHEGLDVILAATRFMQRILQQHVGGSESQDCRSCPRIRAPTDRPPPQYLTL